MKKEFYRFRSLKSLFEFKELENQEIYFASPEELNDPMEGFRDLVFKGDKIVWRNFFKHYLLCLERVSSLYIVAGEEHNKITQDSIPVYDGFDDFPTPMYKESFERISNEFFDICGDFIDKVATRTTTIKRDELSAHFNTIHHIAVNIIEENYIKSKFLPKRKNSIVIDTKGLDISIGLIDLIEQNINEIEENKLNVLFDIQQNMQNEFILANNINDNLAIKAPNRNFVLIDFVENYLNSLEKLLHNNWYTACFMTEYNNSSVWGHYGDKHKGVCLIFESDESESIEFQNAHTGTGSKGKYYRKRNLNFKQIKYTDEYQEIDFFRSIGRLSVSKIISTWYSNEMGIVSNIEREVFNDEEKWREDYWNKFYETILTKNNDWSYENEYRLMLFSGLNDLSDNKDRVLKYNFKHLKGLIFGMKTPIEEKLQIINIIHKKCIQNNRDAFEFHQAYYCHIKKNIQSRKMSFIKFGNKNNNINKKED